MTVIGDTSPAMMSSNLPSYNPNGSRSFEYSYPVRRNGYHDDDNQDDRSSDGGRDSPATGDKRASSYAQDQEHAAFYGRPTTFQKIAMGFPIPTPDILVPRSQSQYENGSHGANKPGSHPYPYFVSGAYPSAFYQANGHPGASPAHYQPDQPSQSSSSPTPNKDANSGSFRTVFATKTNDVPAAAATIQHERAYPAPNPTGGPAKPTTAVYVPPHKNSATESSPPKDEPIESTFKSQWTEWSMKMRIEQTTEIEAAKKSLEKYHTGYVALAAELEGKYNEMESKMKAAQAERDEMAMKYGMKVNELEKAVEDKRAAQKERREAVRERDAALKERDEAVSSSKATVPIKEEPTWRQSREAFMASQEGQKESSPQTAATWRLASAAEKSQSPTTKTVSPDDEENQKRDASFRRMYELAMTVNQHSRMLHPTAPLRLLVTEVLQEYNRRVAIDIARAFTVSSSVDSARAHHKNTPAPATATPESSNHTQQEGKDTPQAHKEPTTAVSPTGSLRASAPAFRGPVFE